MVVGVYGLYYFEYTATFPRYQPPNQQPGWEDELATARDYPSGAPALVDLDDDGDLDLVVLNLNHTNQLFLNNGEGQFASVEASGFPSDFQ